MAGYKPIIIYINKYDEICEMGMEWIVTDGGNFILQLRFVLQIKAQIKHNIK